MPRSTGARTRCTRAAGETRRCSRLPRSRSAYPRSRWIKDAAALDLEIRQASGQAPAVDTAGTDDLKLMALGGLMNADPARALPLIKQMLARVADRCRA